MNEESCRAAVFSGPGEPLRIQQFALPESIEPGAAVCRIRMSTICGSDLHTIGGKRQEPTPIILGHEIIGDIAALGDGLEADGFGQRLRVGDRVSWSIMASCAACFYCRKGLPQKCTHLHKYGHTGCNEPPGLTGGYAEYIYLFPGTAIFRVPGSVSDEIATPANCALSTAMNAIETIGFEQGETVLIQGAGSMGLNLVAALAEAGARKIIVTDVNPKRLELASGFGADLCIDIAASSDEEILTQIRDQSGEHGVDVAFEACGASVAVAQAVEALRIGGRYLIAGLVSPGSDLGIEGNQVTRKCLTIKGIHNYRPEHLGQALRFLEQNCARLPYRELVGSVFPLAEINEAVRVASSGKHIRVAIRPTL